MTSQPEFGKETTSEQVVEAFADQIRGKTILITGISPNGLGEAMVLALASQHPSTLLLTARTISKAQYVAEKLHSSFPSIAIKAINLDLSDLSSVRQAAKSILQSTPHIDILINNAGVMGLPTRTLSKDGIEMHLATNFLGHFLLTNLLYPILTATSSRVINITSGGYMVTPFRFSDYNFSLPVSSLPSSEQPDEAAIQMLRIPDYLSTRETYVPLIAYLQSNIANVLFTNALAEKGIQAFSAAPGVVVTELQRYMPEGFRNPVMFYKSASQGAATFLVAALDPALKVLDRRGGYLDDCQVVELVEYAKDKDNADRLWALGEELVGEKFNLISVEMG